GVLDMPSRVLFYVDAGHPPPLCCRGDRISPLTSNALLLGADQFVAEEQCHQFEQGDRLVLYTDGVVETRNTQGQLYSVQRLEETVRDLAGRTAEQTVETIFSQLDSFSSEQGPDDDATVVVLDFA
ncbi:MAG: serine/threonine-protein phosphatase, partial [Phycisphaerae bacterium]|nr:serine/threonine-protein phosphatase [Phycisphaerae bacterium]